MIKNDAIFRVDLSVFITEDQIDIGKIKILSQLAEVLRSFSEIDGVSRTRENEQF